MGCVVRVRVMGCVCVMGCGDGFGDVEMNLVVGLKVLSMLESL